MPAYFLRKTPKAQFILNGWRYRTAIGLSAKHRSLFGPQPKNGERTGPTYLLLIREDDATFNFDAIIQHARKLVGQNNFANYRPHNPVSAYQAMLVEAERQLACVRVELNRVIEELRAGRRVSKHWDGWNEADRAAGFNVVEIHRGVGRILKEAAE
jgi:hypothetical protein